MSSVSNITDLHRPRYSDLGPVAYAYIVGSPQCVCGLGDPDGSLAKLLMVSSFDIFCIQLRDATYDKLLTLETRFLDPDPLLLVSAPGSREERTERNSKFHALNRAIVQLVRNPSPSPCMSLTFPLRYNSGYRMALYTTDRGSPARFVPPT